MRPVVTVVDYGRSNLLSVRRALEHCGADVRFAAEPGDVLRAGALVLPGVGAFADGMAQLRRQRLVEPLLQKAGEGAPLLGICLGMQMLLDSSTEGGLNQGLGLVEGTVEPLPETGFIRARGIRSDGTPKLFIAGSRKEDSTSKAPEAFSMEIPIRSPTNVGKMDRQFSSPSFAPCVNTEKTGTLRKQPKQRTRAIQPGTKKEAILSMSNVLICV